MHDAKIKIAASSGGSQINQHQSLECQLFANVHQLFSVTMATNREPRSTVLLVPPSHHRIDRVRRDGDEN
ncbi:hypothetical protein J6590_024545 [Homalodisca vitripennis]|nr:hypothetical protein J6590_024545 [Homalodisca vitripennis]